MVYFILPFIHELIAKQQPNICQIVAYQNNEKVYSDCWNDYKADDCTHIMSATKSIMALLIGIALDIVVAVASYFKPTVFDRVDFIREYIEPLFTDR